MNFPTQIRTNNEIHNFHHIYLLNGNTPQEVLLQHRYQNMILNIGYESEICQHQ